MGTDPLTAVRASLRRLKELGLERPSTSSIRDWLVSLANEGILEPQASRDIADCYDTLRFGGNPVDSARWAPLELTLKQSVTEFEALDVDKREVIIKKLRPVSPPQPRQGGSPGRSEPVDRARPFIAPPGSTRLRWALALGALALVVGTVFYLWNKFGNKDEASPPQKPPVASPAFSPVELNAPVSTSAAGLFRSRLDLPGGSGASVSLVDYDLDGDLDVFLASNRKSILLENRGEQLVAVSGDLGLAEPTRSGQWADFDGDGDLDLAVTSTRRTAVLFRREGARFTRIQLPISRPHNPEGHGWIDFDADGDPDLLVTNGKMGVHLFENEAGDLRDVSAAAGFGPSGWGRDNGDFVHFLDFDLDGRVDILYAATTGLAARNVDGQRFEAVSAPLKFAMINGSQKQAMAMGDIDGDRDLDVFAPQRSGASLYENRAGEFAGFFGRPSIGSWLNYGIGNPSENLPGYVVLTAGRGASGGASLWSSGFLPSTYAGVLFRTGAEPVLNLTNPAGDFRRDAAGFFGRDSSPESTSARTDQRR